jgi:hypothetical protein
MATSGKSSPPTEAADYLDEVVRIACAVAGRQTEIRSVQVVLPTRPTYDELRRYRRFAAAKGLALSASGSEQATLRLQPPSYEPVPAKRDWSVWPRIPHGRWLADLEAMSEGTR